MTAQAANPHRRLLFGIGVVAVLLVPQIPFGRLLAPGNVAVANIIWAVMAAAVLLWVVYVERLPLASIGLRKPTWRTLAWGIAAIVPLMASVMLSYAVILPALGLRMNMAAATAITALPIWLQLALFVRAGVCEEILYRGYPIERLEALTGSRWIAALVPGVVFVLSHYAYWGGGQLVVAAFGALILTLLYLWRRDLVCCMIAHVLTDAIGFALAALQTR